MHWQNTGRDLVTSASAILQVWFGAGPFHLNLVGSFNIAFQFVISADQTSNEFPRTSPMQTVVRHFFMRLQFFAYLIFGLTACGQPNSNSQKGAGNPQGDTAQKQLKTMSDYSPIFENAHSKAKALMNEDFYFSPIDETAPFGNDDGADTYAGFKDWRQTHAAENPKVFLYEQISYWGYPEFDIFETDIQKLTPYLKQSDLGSRYMSGIDAAIIAIAFGQLYLEGKVDNDFNELAKTSIRRQLLPELLALWGETYKVEREAKLKKMLTALTL